MRLSIIGTGYVGLVTGACLAETGHDVVCVDIDPARVAALNAARSPMFEAGLDELLARNVGHRLNATTDLATAVRRSDMTFIAVGTPFDGGAIDLTAVRQASEQVGRALQDVSGYHVVVVKSTVVPGTTDTCVLRSLESASGKQAGRDFGLGMNPEFLSEAEAVRDFMSPDRIVIGGIDERSIDVIDEVYRAFPDTPRVRTNLRTAEMIKYASNALVATLISFSNEMANLASALGGIDALDVMRGVELSQYFTSRNAESLPPITAFLRAGCGYGGSCLPKDTKALVAHGRHAGIEMPLLTAVIETNEEQPYRVVALLEKHWQDLTGVRVAILGLAFKPGTSDVRESPAFPIARRLIARGAVVSAYDPVAVDEAKAAFPNPAVHYCRDLESAIDGVDAIVVVTPWDDFRSVPTIVCDRAPHTVLVDCRGAFERGCVPRYEAIGF